MSDDSGGITVRKLTKRYGSGRAPAVDSFDLSVRVGEVFGLLGPNGAGKSTTIAMLCGLLPPSAGSASVAGIDISRDESRAELQRRIGVVRAETSPYPHLTAREYLEWCGNLRGLAPAESRRRAEELLNLLDLSVAADRRIGEYSQGMRRKTALAGTLLHAPRVLFLDEALNGIDPPSVHVIVRLLRRLTEKGVAVLFTSHVLETVERLCDRIAILDRGRIVAQGTVGELRGQADVEEEAPLEEVFVRLIGKPVPS